MLGKLIKYELKSNCLLNIIILGGLIVTSCILGILIRVDTEVQNISTSFTVFLMMLASCAYFFVFGGIVVFIITIIKSNYLRMFSDFGVLNFSIPVKTDTMILSKYICFFIWYFSLILTYIVSLALLLLITSGNGIIAEIFYTFFQDFWEFVLFLLFITLKVFFIYTIFLCAIIVMNSGFIRRAQFIAAIGAFVVVGIFCIYFSRIVYVIPYALEYNQFGLHFIKLEMGEAGLYSFNSIFYELLLTVGAIFLNRYLLKNRLELQ